MSDLVEKIARIMLDVPDDWTPQRGDGATWSYAKRRAKVAIAARDAALSAEGLVLVPMEPTKAMIDAGENKLEECTEYGWDSGLGGEGCKEYRYYCSGYVAEVYRAMLAAAENQDA